jgi:hypothetical protein
MSIPSPQLHMQSMGPDTWSRMPDDQHEPLPSKEIALMYIDGKLSFTLHPFTPLTGLEFFKGFCVIFPLFSKPDFMERFEREYPVTASQNPAWYACLNVAFTIGSVGVNKHKARGSPNSASSASSPRSQYPEEEDWWKWFRNASSTFIDLQFREGSMLAVQAMIGMVSCFFVLSTSANYSSPSSFRLYRVLIHVPSYPVPLSVSHRQLAFIGIFMMLV